MKAAVVGPRIRERRERIGLSLRELAAVAGVSPAMLSRWERGKGEIPGFWALRLAEVLRKGEEAWEARRRLEFELSRDGLGRAAFWKVGLDLNGTPDLYSVVAENLGEALQKVLKRSFDPFVKARKVFGEEPWLGIFEAYKEEGGQERKVGQFYIVMHRFKRSRVRKGGS